MLVPLSWLSEFIEIRGSVGELCRLLTFAGVETEIAEDERPTWPGVITAKLVSVDRHPGADRLTHTRPNDGARDYSVVCGATNQKAGDVVALATVGTVLPGDFKIKKSKIRGVISEGMLCSEKELGLSEESDGILILPPDTPLGVPLAEVLSTGDVLLEVSPTANRGDCQSVLGVARELAAVSGWPLVGAAAEPPAADEAPGAAAATAGAGSRGLEVNVSVEAPAACPRYVGAVLRGVEVRPSPAWMRRRLEACGVRAINSVVDCTNYVMLELGNPLHAFDWRSIRGQWVCVRMAAPGESAVTLDGSRLSLTGDDLVIADAEGIIALAGVMGGENSEVKDDSVTLFLEAAHFDPLHVRRTAHRCRLSTEASYRFSRGVDPRLPGRAMRRLIGLLIQTSGGEQVGEIADVYPQATARPPVRLRHARIAGLLGLEMSPERAVELLERGGLSPSAPRETERGLVIEVTPPGYRFDIEREVDVLEEIARLGGFEEIPERLPVKPMRAVPRQAAGVDLDGLREAMARQGLAEAIHYSFIAPEWLADLGLPEDHPWRAEAVPVGNPLSEVGSILRPTLLPSLLRSAARNRAVGARDLRLFELRTRFRSRPEGFEALLAGRDGRPLDKTPVIETRGLAVLLSGRRSPPGWATGDEEVDASDMLACLEAALATLKAEGWQRATDDLPPFLDPREGATLRRGRQVAGWMGRIAAPVLQTYGLDVPIFAFEIDADMLSPRKPKPFKFKPFSRFPGVERDLALVVPDAFGADWVVACATSPAKKGMKQAFQGVEIFDVYRGEGIPPGTRSLALRFRFRALDRTLNDKEIDRVMKKVEAALTRKGGIHVRR